MWTMAFGLYVCCKWLTYWEALRRGAHADARRAVAYLVAWPGMDAITFLSDNGAERPRLEEWPDLVMERDGDCRLERDRARPQRRARMGQPLGHQQVEIRPGPGAFLQGDLDNPAVLGGGAVRGRSAAAMSTSLSDLGPSLEHGVSRPRRPGDVPSASSDCRRASAAAVVFLLSGLLHELVISSRRVEAMACRRCKLALQAFGVIVERTPAAKAVGLGPACAAGVHGGGAGVPVFMLFPVFVRAVMLPMLARIGAM
jgi:hypothetical protein